MNEDRTFLAHDGRLSRHDGPAPNEGEIPHHHPEGRSAWVAWAKIGVKMPRTGLKGVPITTEKKN